MHIKRDVLLFSLVLLVTTIVAARPKKAVPPLSLNFYTKFRVLETESVYYRALQATQPAPVFKCLEVPWEGVICNNGINQARKILIKRTKNDDNIMFTICAHGHYKKILPLLDEIGVDVLFTPQAPPNERYKNIRILPILHWPNQYALTKKEKDILYSFIGFCSHPFRKKMIAITQSSKNDVCIKERKKWFAGKKERPESKEYRDVISRSRFGLCPKGYFPNTIRFLELIFSDTIPVIIADHFTPPGDLPWNDCMIRIKESDIHDIDSIIRSIPPEQEERMRTCCRHIAQLLQEDPASIIRYQLDTLLKENL